MPAAQADAQVTQAPLGAVLAGGAGTRIGRSKAGVELCARPLIAYPLEALAAAGLEAVVIAKPATQLPDLDVPVVVEPPQPLHPLLGIVTALRHAARPVVVVGCDMPFVAPRLLGRLAAERHAVALPRVAGRLEPLIARYSPAAMGPLERALAAGAALRHAAAELDPRVLEQRELEPYGDPQRLVFSVNTRADLAAAESLLRRSRWPRD